MKPTLHTLVSYYSRITSPGPVNAELYDLLTTDRYKPLITAVRNELDDRKKRELKNRLPAFTPSGLFKGAAGSTLIRPTGFICIDIDGKDNRHVPDYANLKARLARLPDVAYCGLSAGGEGYFCLIPIAQPNNFLRHFLALQAEFAAMGIIIDGTCRDIGRKRFVSYDPVPYINPDATVYEGFAEELPERTTTDLSCSTDANPELLDRVQKFIGAISEKETDITTKYEDWLRIGYAFGNTFGDVGREMFHAVSRFYPSYSPDETDTLFNGILKGSRTGRTTIATFFYLARQAGLDAVADFIDVE